MIPPFTDPAAPKAPFKVGSTPRAAWYCIEVAFRHECPHPDAIKAALGRPVKYEFATADTLAHLADVFRKEEKGGRGILVTRDHSSFFMDAETRATGWIKDLHAEGDQLWAWIEWTPYGHDMVNNGEFIHFSTEYEYADFLIHPEGAEPQRLAACTLTNEPRHRGQTPCTNSKVQPQTMKQTQTTTKPRRARNADAADDRLTTASNAEDEQTPAATNGDEEPAETKAPEGSEGDWTNPQGLPRRGEPPMGRRRVNSDEEPAATNSDDDPTAANGDEAAPAGMTLEDAVQQAAALLGLPEDASPEDFLNAIKAQQDSISELNAALEEAGTETNSRTGNSRRRFSRLTARNASTTRLSGGLPNRAVNVSVGKDVRAVNTQDKALADYCRKAVEDKEKSIGRALNASEYSETYGRARRAFFAGNNR